MSISTTVNIKSDYKTIIADTALTLKISKSSLIHRLLTLAIKKYPLRVKTFKRIRYQQRNPETIWKKMHVNLRTDIYEQCLDMKKLAKVSVSFFLAMAIEQYLDELIMLMTCSSSKNDNYCSCYAITVKYHNCDLIFTISHGLPPH